MSSKDQYRRFAAASLDLAKNAEDLPAKIHFIIMAEAWLDLAVGAVSLVDLEAYAARMDLERSLKEVTFQGKSVADHMVRNDV